MAGLAGHVLTAGDRTAAFVAFGLAAVTMVGLVFILATAVGVAQDRLITNLKRSTHTIKRWSGGVLIVVGVWLLALAIWAAGFARLFPV